MQPFVIYHELMSPEEIRELLQTPCASLRISASLLDIASVHYRMFVEHATPRGYGRTDIALTPTWARLAIAFPPFVKIVNPYGGAVIFDGRTVHRGCHHPGTRRRMYLYAAIFTGSDPNA